jgi:hypothetical protein
MTECPRGGFCRPGPSGLERWWTTFSSRVKRMFWTWEKSLPQTLFYPLEHLLGLQPFVNLKCKPKFPTLIGLDLSLTALVGIAGKRKQILTCTQETTRAELERLWSVRLIHGDQQITTRHAKALLKIKGLMSLLATSLSLIKPVN